MNKKILFLLFSALLMTQGLLALPEEVFIGKSLTQIEQMERKYKNDNSADGKIIKAILLHNKSRFISDPADLLEEALSLLDGSDNSVAIAYTGSLITLQAADAIKNNNPLKALQLLNKGCQLIDKAVKADPDNSVLRQLRLENGIELSESSPMDRYSVIWKDAEWLLTNSRVKNQTRTYLLAGKAALGVEEYDLAFEYLEEVIEREPESDMAVEADDILFELEE